MLPFFPEAFFRDLGTWSHEHRFGHVISAEWKEQQCEQEFVVYNRLLEEICFAKNISYKILFLAYTSSFR